MQERVNKEIELEKRRLEVLEELTETDEKRFLERREKAGIISVEEYNIALMEVEKKWAGIRASEEEKADREAEQQRKEAEEKRLSERAEAVAELEQQFQQERLERLQSFQRGEIATREELDQLNEAAELDSMNRRKDLLLQQGEDITAIQLEIAQKEIDIEKRKNDELIKEQERLSMARMRVLGDSFRMLGALNQGFVKDEKQRENLRKAIAVGEIATDTALAISAAVKASSQNPANAVTAGGAGAVQLAASLVKIGTNIGSAMAILRSGNVGGGIGSGGGRGAAGAMASGSVMPQFNIRETMAEQMDTRVFVVEDDIRDMTNRVDDFNRVSVID
jgi:hypothetical protein